MPAENQTCHVSIVAIPDAVISTLSGIYDVLNSFEMLAGWDEEMPRTAPFEIEIVGETAEPVHLASGLPVQPHAAVRDVARTDIIIVPSVVISGGRWERGRYPQLTGWLERRHADGAVLCSACSGVFLLAETGLFDGRETTIHWEYQEQFQTAFPEVPLKPEQVLIVTGARDDLISSGASNTWHDLVLYLIARFVSPHAAQFAARSFALQWHRDGMAPYMRFVVPTDHGDAVVGELQNWLDDHYSIAAPVEEMVRRSGLAARTFKRRFTAAVGCSPITYVQRVRIEAARRKLEQGSEPVEQISWQVGYEDPSAFRRLFKRITGITPAAYRRKFQVPEY
jgi:transcriptional regulator GlxA family with amidase domain